MGNSAEVRQDFALVELKEPCLVGANLVDVDVVVARVYVFLDGFAVLRGVGAAGDRLGEGVFVHQLGGLLEVGGGGQVLREFAGDARVGPPFQRGALGLRFVGGVADGQLAVAGLA